MARKKIKGTNNFKNFSYYGSVGDLNIVISLLSEYKTLS